MTMNRRRIVKLSFRRGAALALAVAALALSGTQAAAAPTQREDRTLNAPPGVLVSILAFAAFDNAGTNPRITNAVFSDTTYYNTAMLREDNGIVFIEAKSEADLNAMSPRPDSPIRTTVVVTMTNDEGQTATGTFTLETAYEKATTQTTPAPQPALSQTTALNAPPGTLVTVAAADVFDNAGTNPRFTSVHFSSTAAYYELAGMSFASGSLVVQAKTAEELRSQSPPPENPFTVTAEVTMSNDEGQTATGTLTFRTTYVTDPEPEVPGSRFEPENVAD